MIPRAAGFTLIVSFLATAGVAAAQEPAPPTHQSIPGFVGLSNAAVEVTKRERVRVKLACPDGPTACAGRLQITTVKRFAPAKGKAKRRLTVVETSIGELAGGQVKTFNFALHKDARALVRRVRTTRVEWQMTSPDGAEQQLPVSHLATLTSRAAG